jgi:cobalt-zinc-cadmium efflux system outer membrane protein
MNLGSVLKGGNVLILAVLALNFSASVSAEDAPTVSTNSPVATVEALVAEALEKNPELKFYEAEIVAAKAGRKTAGTYANPEFSGTFNRTAARDPNSGLADEGLGWSASIVQPFEWPGRMALRKSIANREVALAEIGYQRFKVALANRVKTLAYGVFAAQQKSATALEVADRFRELREVLMQRDPAGLTPLLETRVIEATELNAQKRATDAELFTQNSLLELNQLRGIRSDTPLAIAPTDLSFRSVGRVDELFTLAQTNNFELKARIVDLEQQGIRVDLAKNERYPTISVGPNYSRATVGRAAESETIVGLGISLPLPLWNRNEGNITAAEARRTQAAVSLNVAERDLQRRVMEAALTYNTKIRAMKQWRPESVQHFREAAELADRHYRLGAVPVATYVELQKQYLDAVDGLLDTKKEALDAAAQLELLTGLPEPLARTIPKEETK